MPEEGKKSKKTLKILLIVLAALVAIFAVILIIGSVAAKGDTVFPNVKINGVNVGGLTESQAQHLLTKEAENYSHASVTVNFPGGKKGVITSLDAGLTPTSAQAARLAIDYGRTGNIFSNSFKYFRCIIGIGMVDLNDRIDLLLNVENLQARISEIAREINTDPVQASYEIMEATLYLTKGTEGTAVDEEDLLALVSAAFMAGEFENIDYKPVTVQPDEVNLQEVYDEIFLEPQNSVYDRATGAATVEVNGISFDIEAAELTIDTIRNGETAEIPLVITVPKVTQESLNQVLFATVLSSKSTSLTNNSNRNTNIQLAAAEINGFVLNPGEKFSFNDVVGQRTTDRGFMPAGAYSDGQTVTEVGGGICQVSSTIYYTVLMANLEVVNRLSHTFTVGYLPLGMDATVSWGGPEFIFANNTEYPIKIKTWRDGLTFNVEIYGTKTDGYTYRLDSKTTSTVNYATEYVDDPSMPAGTSTVTTAGHVGYTVDTYRYTYDEGGNLVREEKVNTSAYSKLNEVITRGTG